MIHSNEFSIFSRKKGDLDKFYGSIIKEKPADTLQKYKRTVNIIEDWDISTIVKAYDDISEFKIFVNKSLITMEVISIK